MKNYEVLASKYAEEYGIIEYKVDGNKMIYYANYPEYMSEKRRSYKVAVNLDEMKEESRVLLSKWNKNGNHNMYK